MASDPSNALHPDFWRALHDAQAVSVSISAGPIFRQGEQSRGVYLVEEGEVRLFLEEKSKPGRLFDVAGPGSVLGLSETMSGGPHKLTAEAAAGARVSCIERAAFIDFVSRNQPLCLQIVRLLSEDLHSLYYRFRVMASEPKSGKGPIARVN